jgi:4-amino-4-deoxy-L-arabinose transferase-like glycosyltransferase
VEELSGIYHALGNWKLDSRRLIAAKLLTPAVIVLAALLPRLVALGRYVTPDEPIWVYRSLGFREALLSADWPNTIQSGHPGVITTWLGAIGVQLQLWLQPESRSHLEWINKLYWLAPDNGPAIQHLATFLPTARLMVILLASLGVVAIFLLARDRLGFGPALLAALLLAVDPFVAGLSGLLHVDALLATFMLITLLLVLPKRDSHQQIDEEDRFPVGGVYFALAGLSTALAILSKTPGLLLLLFVPAVVLWLSIKSRSAIGGLKALLIWGATLLLCLLIFLPALWADPGHVIDMTSGLAERLIDTAVRPTFFLGQVTLEPGNAFYPLAIAFRLSPAVSLALLGLLAWLLYRLVTRRPLRIPANAVWLMLLSLSFILFLNLAAKRFDRYALPAIMPLILIAGWGIAVAAKKPTLVAKRRFWLELIIGILLFQLIYALLYWPYPLTAYNWLLGGPAVAQRVLPMGWGEGTGAGAQWAAELPGSENRTLFAGSVPAAAPFIDGRSMSLGDQNLSRLEEDDVLLFSSRDWQLEPEAFEVDPGSDTPTLSISMAYPGRRFTPA